MTDEEFNVALEQFLNAKDEKDLEKLPEDFPEELARPLDNAVARKVAEKLVSLGDFFGIYRYGYVIENLISDHLDMDKDYDLLKALVNNYIDGNNECVAEDDYEISSETAFWIIVGTYFENSYAEDQYDMCNENLEEDWADVADYTASVYYERLNHEEFDEEPEIEEDTLEEEFDTPKKRKSTKEVTPEEKPVAPKKTKFTKKASASRPTAPKRKGRKKSSSPLKSAKRAIYNKLVKPLKKWF